MFVLKRSLDNPVLVPSRDRYWEGSATFNMSLVKRGASFVAVYRAISAPDKLRTPSELSIIGRAESADGVHFKNRTPFILPKEEWEKYGCEDPRVTYFEGTNYIFYTALGAFPFNAEGIKVAVALSEDLKKIDERHLVTPFNAKAMALFPERVGKKITVILSAHTDSPPAKIAIAQVNSIEELWSEAFWKKWHDRIDDFVIDPRRSPYDHVEVGAAPIKTKYGWLLVYSHIQNYFENPDHFERVFGIEALLLDIDDPRKIIGRTGGPFLVPEESYELSGYVNNIVFPSGAVVEGDKLSIYYGASDTTVSKASVSLSDLISTMNPKTEAAWKLTRSHRNPILVPDHTHPWEAKAVFNAGVFEANGKINILYRALSEENTSVIGLAVSKDGIALDERLPAPIYVPREPFETKKIAQGNSGCEDPRITQIGKTVYMCYTAFDGIGPPRVALTSISEHDFNNRHWHWEKPILITPPGIDDKDTCILPEKIGGKYFIMHRIGTDICGDYVDSLDFKGKTVNKCIRVLGPRPGMWDSAKLGIAGPPLKTKGGWLLLYHAVSKNHHTYRLGAALLDSTDPALVLARGTDPLLWPEEEYEKNGIVNNVVFSCGMAVKKGILYVYYGGGDRVLGVATMKLDTLLKSLEKSVQY